MLFQSECFILSLVFSVIQYPVVLCSSTELYSTVCSLRESSCTPYLRSHIEYYNGNAKCFMLKSKQHITSFNVFRQTFLVLRLRLWFCCLSSSPAISPGQQVGIALPVSQVDAAHSSFTPTDQSLYPVIHWVFYFEWRALCVRD